MLRLVTVWFIHTVLVSHCSLYSIYKLLEHGNSVRETHQLLFFHTEYMKSLDYGSCWLFTMNSIWWLCRIVSGVKMKKEYREFIEANKWEYSRYTCFAGAIILSFNFVPSEPKLVSWLMLSILTIIPCVNQLRCKLYMQSRGGCGSTRAWVACWNSGYAGMLLFDKVNKSRGKIVIFEKSAFLFSILLYENWNKIVTKHNQRSIKDVQIQIYFHDACLLIEKTWLWDLPSITLCWLSFKTLLHLLGGEGFLFPRRGLFATLLEGCFSVKLQ